MIRLSSPVSGFKTPLSSAFTLVELLVVISILILVSAFVLPSMNSIVGGTSLTSSARELTGYLQNARLTALSLNKPIEVRFYKFADSSRPGSVERYRAVGSLRANPDGTTERIGKILPLSPGVAMDDSTTNSPLLDDSKMPTRGTEEDGISTGIDLEENVPYISFRFRADGSTDIADKSAEYFVTLVSDQDLKADRMDNFATVQLDPLNGNIRLYRPEVE